MVGIRKKLKVSGNKPTGTDASRILKQVGTDVNVKGRGNIADVVRLGNTKPIGQPSVEGILKDFRSKTNRKGLL